MYGSPSVLLGGSVFGFYSLRGLRWLRWRWKSSNEKRIWIITTDIQLMKPVTVALPFSDLVSCVHVQNQCLQ